MTHGEMNLHIENKLNTIPIGKINELKAEGRTTCKAILSSKCRSSKGACVLSRYTPIALQFNEASFATIATWSLENEFDDILGPRLQSTKETNQKVRSNKEIGGVEHFLRRCTVCKLWGHCDIECKDLSNSPIDMISIAKSIRCLKKRQRLIQSSVSQFKKSPWDEQKGKENEFHRF